MKAGIATLVFVAQSFITTMPRAPVAPPVEPGVAPAPVVGVAPAPVVGVPPGGALASRPPI